MKKVAAALLAATATAMSANAALALDLTCAVHPPEMDPHAVVALRITGQEYGNTIRNLQPVFTLQNGETRDRSVQYQKGWRVEPVNSSSGPATTWQGYYGPGNHHVIAFVKPNDPNETYREDHYTDKGAVDHKDAFRCWPTGTQPTVASNVPVSTSEQGARNRGDQPNPNKDDLQLPRQAPVAATAWPPTAHAGTACPEFSHPIIQAASQKTLTLMRSPRYLQMLNTPDDVLNAFEWQMNEIIVNTSLPPEFKIFIYHRSIDAMKAASLDKWESCFNGISVLVAAVKQKKVDAERAALAAAVEAAKPQNQLYRAYRIYGLVKYCNETRQGYLSVWVNDVELNRAREKIEGIEKDAIAAINDKDFNTEQFFTKAVDSLRGMNVNQQSCHLALVQLFDIKSTSGNLVIEKDF